MKKIVIALICIFMCLCCFACSSNDNDNQANVPIVYVITFETQDGIIRKEVENGKSLEEIPTLPIEKGYTYSWSIADFSCIIKDLTVTLIRTPNEYTINYDLEGLKDVTISSISQKVTFGSFFVLEEPLRPCYEFKGWVDEQGNGFSDGKYNLDKSVTLKALWEEDDNWSGRA